LSGYFQVTAFREGQKEKTADFEKAPLIKEYKETKTAEENGYGTFIPTNSPLNYHYIHEYHGSTSSGNYFVDAALGRTWRWR